MTKEENEIIAKALILIHQKKIEQSARVLAKMFKSKKYMGTTVIRHLKQSIIYDLKIREQTHRGLEYLISNMQSTIS